MAEEEPRSPWLLRFALGAERWLAGLTPRRVQAAEHTIHYLERGREREETLLLIHGFGGDKDNWVRFVRHLGPLRTRYRIVSVDLPGFGDSDRRDDVPYSVPAQVERLQAFADALQLGPLHLVGNSMGGAIAGRWAARDPERVRSLCMLEPVALRGTHPAALEQLLEEGVNPLLVERPEDFETLLAFVFEERPFLPAPVRHFLARRAASRHAHLSRIWPHVWDDLREPLAGHLEAIRAPTLLLWGDTNRVFHLSVMEELLRRLPHATGHVFQGCGHVPMVERPRAVGRRFVGWLKAL
jgi:pimeloyl-ACP methyl ester carboxylesterase